MKKLTAILLLALSASAAAQSPDDLAALNAAQDTLRAAQAQYDAARKVVVTANAEAIRQVNLAIDAQTLVRLDSENAALRAAVDTLTAQAAADATRLAALKAVAVTARDAVSKATTIAGLRAAILPLITEIAK